MEITELFIRQQLRSANELTGRKKEDASFDRSRVACEDANPPLNGRVHCSCCDCLPSLCRVITHRWAIIQGVARAIIAAICHRGHAALLITLVMFAYEAVTMATIHSTTHALKWKSAKNFDLHTRLRKIRSHAPTRVKMKPLAVFLQMAMWHDIICLAKPANASRAGMSPDTIGPFIRRAIPTDKGLNNTFSRVICSPLSLLSF